MFFIADKLTDKYSSKTNICDGVSFEHISNVDAVNTKLDLQTTLDNKNNSQTKDEQKCPISLRKKVSIHFKGKVRKTNNSDPSVLNSTNDKKQSVFDVRFIDKEKNRMNHQKTPSIDSKKSTTETSFNQEPKTTSSSDSKHSNDKKMSISGNRKDYEKKLRKSNSVSPERGKQNLHEDGK